MAFNPGGVNFLGGPGIGPGDGIAYGGKCIWLCVSCGVIVVVGAGSCGPAVLAVRVVDFAPLVAVGWMGGRDAGIWHG